MKYFSKIFFIFLIIFIFNFLLFNFFLISKRYFIPHIIFYEGIYSVMLSSLLVLLVSYYLYRKKILKNLSHIFYHIIISFLFIVIIHTNIITIVDRSISIFMLNELYNNDYNKTEIIEVFAKEFPSNAIEKRLNEQIKINNVRIINNKENNLTYEITPKGEIYIMLFNMINKLYNLDKLIFRGNQYE